MSRKSYRNGYRYCSKCRAYYKTEDVRCPECGAPLRTNPKKKKYEVKYVDPMRVLGVVNAGGEPIAPLQSLNEVR